MWAGMWGDADFEKVLVAVSSQASRITFGSACKLVVLEALAETFAFA
jgi:hypothetical protein